MTTSIVDIFKTYKNQPDGDYNSVATEYATLDIEWVKKIGNQVISANTSWGNATADARNLLVLVKGDLTVNAGYTLTAAARKRGMFIYVNGDLTLNGTISMSARGAYAAGARLLICNVGSNYEVAAAGGAGGAALADQGTGNAGTSGIATGACGGGGGGGLIEDTTSTGGGGSAGTSYSGGTGGGGTIGITVSIAGYSGVANGGAGGAGRIGNTNVAAGGGAGNPGGVKAIDGTGAATDGQTGTGGLLVIYVTGTLTVGASGTLSSNGANGGNATSGNYGTGGGGSGGGRIDVFYNTISGTLTKIVNGGAAGTASANWDNRYGGAGGAGSSRETQVSLPDLFAVKGGFGFGNPWIFLKDAYDRNKKLWTPKGLILPKDLGFSY